MFKSRWLPWTALGWLALKAREGWRNTDILPRRRGFSASTLVLSCAGCMAAGAGLMYMLDPERGRHRRAVTRGRVASATRYTTEKIREKMGRPSGEMKPAQPSDSEHNLPSQAQEDRAAEIPTPS